MFSFYQIGCTIASSIFNVVLIYLIIYKSSKHFGKYKYLMIYTSVFEIFWGLFDLPAEVNSFTYGYGFIIYRINHPWAWLTDAQSTLVIYIYTGIFGASLAIFGVNFMYRYGQINKKFGDRFTSGWKFYVLFIIPVFFAIWWATALAFLFDRTQETDDYSRKYELRLFYEADPKNGTLRLRCSAWFGTANLATMVFISMFCVFFFGYQCYRRLCKDLSQLTFVSVATANLQKQLFYSLVVQTTIPIVLMHIPTCIYLLFPMMNKGFNLSSNFVIASITIYPAIDPLPNFFIIKNYRTAVVDCFKKFILRRPITLNNAKPSTLPQPNCS